MVQHLHPGKIKGDFFNGRNGHAGRILCTLHPRSAAIHTRDDTPVLPTLSPSPTVMVMGTVSVLGSIVLFLPGIVHHAWTDGHRREDSRQRLVLHFLVGAAALLRRPFRGLCRRGRSMILPNASIRAPLRTPGLSPRVQITPSHDILLRRLVR